ncbi:Ferredoxin C 2, chloroplastic [Glycine soja]
MALPLLRIPGIPLAKQHQSFPSNTRRKATTAQAELETAVARTGGTGYQSPSVDVPTHKVIVHDRQRGIVHEFVVPEDQYILHTAEAQNITLPFACRHGCCTSCAVRIKNGKIRQPEALGISAELRDKAHLTSLYSMVMHFFVWASQPLMLKWKLKMKMSKLFTFSLSQYAHIKSSCLPKFFPSMVYWLQFGRYFARGPVERDDYALELAMADE